MIPFVHGTRDVRTASDDQLLIWAKTEYGKDCEYAYYSLQKTGQAPKTQTRSWFGFRTKGKK